MHWVTIFVMTIAAVGFLAGCVSEDQSRGVASPPGLDSIAWPGGSTVTQPVVEKAATSVAPVSSLVSGLRTRLAENPEDVKGWALLAQSYAFMANGPRSEEAIARAVELGFDEADLRNRVELAFQSSRTPIESAHPPDWVRAAIGD